MNEQLKPCPFCGGEAYLEDNEIDYLVVCSRCNTAVIPPGEEPGATATREEAIKAWNRRAEGWRDAKTDPPESDGNYFAILNDGHVYELTYDSLSDGKNCWGYETGVFNANGFCGSEWNNVDDVVYWVPLPEPPEVER